MMLWGYKLGYETTTETKVGSVGCFVKVKPEHSAAYGLVLPTMITASEVGAVRDGFATSRLINTEKATTHNFNSAESFPPVGVWKCANTKDSNSPSGIFMLAPSDEGWYKGTGLWLGFVDSSKTFKAGATFCVRIWR